MQGCRKRNGMSFIEVLIRQQNMNFLAKRANREEPNGVEKTRQASIRLMAFPMWRKRQGAEKECDINHPKS